MPNDASIFFFNTDYFYVTIYWILEAWKVYKLMMSGNFPEKASNILTFIHLSYLITMRSLDSLIVLVHTNTFKLCISEVATLHTHLFQYPIHSPLEWEFHANCQFFLFAKKNYMFYILKQADSRKQVQLWSLWGLSLNTLCFGAVYT